MTHPLAPIVLSDPRAIAGAGIDVLVIGSGTSGVTAGIELAGRGLRVALLEAGPLLLTEHVGSGPFANRGDFVPEIHDAVRYRTLWAKQADPAGAAAEPNNNAWAVVGGRTVFWGGCTPRFRDEDFAAWPYGADEMRPWYEKAERLMGVSGGDGSQVASSPFMAHAAQQRLMDRLGAAGIPSIHAPLGVDTRPVAQGHMSLGFDSSVSRLLRCPLFGRVENGARLSLAADTTALKLVLDGRAVKAVRVRHGGETFDIPARHVVMAGSCLQSVRLAMVSGLAELDPGIGCYVGDHLFRQAVLRLPEAIGEKSLYIFVPPTAERPYHAQIQGMFGETWYSPLHATVWLDGERDGRHLLFYCFGISTAERASRVVLRGDGAGIEDYYVVNERSPSDLATLAAMKTFTGEVAAGLGAELLRTEEHCAGSALHEYGGLRMGKDKDSSVTDPDGRFWRVGNLSCVDAATWPHQGSANSYLTITAVALRNASRLAATLAG
ncbi:MAG: GMC family oxidoreductase [Proteobacteria bacterium]|nr:GMC family oxidoreductase [Pseudomonadota bacterium]